MHPEEYENTYSSILEQTTTFQDVHIIDPEESPENYETAMDLPLVHNNKA